MRLLVCYRYFLRVIVFFILIVWLNRDLEIWGNGYVVIGLLKYLLFNGRL